MRLHITIFADSGKYYWNTGRRRLQKPGYEGGPHWSADKLQYVKGKVLYKKQFYTIGIFVLKWASWEGFTEAENVDFCWRIFSCDLIKYIQISDIITVSM